MNIQRGFRSKLEDYFNILQPLNVEISISGDDIYDCCCFGVDIDEKLSDENYMVFYNQTASPENAITVLLKNNFSNFTISLNKLPKTMQKLVFISTIDGKGTMQNIDHFIIKINQPNKEALMLSLSGKDFQNEKTIIGLEFYIKDVWRMSTIARGFNRGFSEFLKTYGWQDTELETINAGSPNSSDFAIPMPPIEQIIPIVQLDMNKVTAIKIDSEKVSSLLKEIFTSENEQLKPLDDIPTPIGGTKTDHSCIWNLPTELSNFIYILIGKPIWTIIELEQLAAKQRLMLEGTLEEINDAAFDNFDEPLTEETENGIEINQDIVKELVQ